MNVPFVLYLLLTLKEIASPLRNIDKPSPQKPVTPVKPDKRVVEPIDEKPGQVSGKRLKIDVNVTEPRLMLLAIQDNEKADSLVVEVYFNNSCTSILSH